MTNFPNPNWPHGQLLQVPVPGTGAAADFLLTRTSELGGRPLAAREGRNSLRPEDHGGDGGWSVSGRRSGMGGDGSRASRPAPRTEAQAQARYAGTVNPEEPQLLRPGVLRRYGTSPRARNSSVRAAIRS